MKKYCVCIYWLSAVFVSFATTLQLSQVECTKLAKQYFASGDLARAYPLALQGDKNDAELLGLLGLMYYCGQGVEENQIVGTNYLWRSFELGEMRAGLILTEKVLLPQRELKLAEEVLQKIIKRQKSSDVCRLLGDLERRKDNCDIESAGRWYKESIDEALSPTTKAYEAYGEWLFSAKPFTLLTRDILKKAADGNSWKAQYCLGLIYCAGGSDFAKDFDLAEKYFTAAKNNSDCPALVYAEAVCSLCTIEGFKGNGDSSVEKLKSLFEASRAIGKRNRGVVASLICGAYLEKSKIDMADKWAHIAGGCDVWDAIALVGEYYQSKGESSKAMEYYEKSAKNGSVMGMVALAKSYLVNGTFSNDMVRRYANKAVKIGLENYKNSDLIYHGRMIAENALGEAYCVLAMLEKKEGNMVNASKLILEGLSKCRNHVFLNSLLIDCIRDGTINSNVADQKSYVTMMRLSAEYDRTGCIDVLLAQYLIAYPSIKTSAEEVELLYKRAAGKGNSAAIVYLSSAFLKKENLTKEEKERLYQLLIAAKWRGENDIHYDQVVLSLREGALKGWWEMPNLNVKTIWGRKYYSFMEGVELMCEFDYLNKNKEERICKFKNIKRKILEAQGIQELEQVFPIYISVCDFMSDKNAEESLSIMNDYAQKGNIIAIFFLSIIYSEGINVERDISKAKRMIDIGEYSSLELRGYGVGEQFFTKAMNMMRRRLDDTETNKRVGEEQGMLELISKLEGMASKGVQQAELMLLILCRNGCEGFDKDKQRADLLYERIVSKASASNLRRFAEFCLQGCVERGIPSDVPLAIMLYKKAKEKGDGIAACKLEELLNKKDYQVEKLEIRPRQMKYCRHCGQLLDGDKIGRNCSHCGKDVFQSRRSIYQDVK